MIHPRGVMQVSLHHCMFIIPPSLCLSFPSLPTLVVFTVMLDFCKGNSQIPIFQLYDSCNSLQFLWLCAIVHLKSRTKLQYPLITQYMSHIVYPYHIVPLFISVPCYCHTTPSPSCFTYYFQYFLYFISFPCLSSVICHWLLCTLFLM